MMDEITKQKEIAKLPDIRDEIRQKVENAIKTDPNLVHSHITYLKEDSEQAYPCGRIFHISVDITASIEL